MPRSEKGGPRLSGDVDKHEGGVPKIVRDIADGFSTQVKFSNRVWLSLIVAATFVLFPKVTGEYVTLPFALGNVDVGTYKVVGFLILSILMLAFCQAYAAAHFATRLAHEVIAEIPGGNNREEARRFFDLLGSSSLARVSSLAHMTGRHKIGAVYYSVLKLVAAAVIVGIPSTALAITYAQIAGNPTVARSVQLVAIFVFVVTSVAVIQISYLELRHAFRVTVLFWKGELIRPTTSQP